MKIRRLLIVGMGVLLMSGILGVAQPVKAAEITVKVTAYGANGADAVVDTNAIQDALDAVATAGEGTVEVPAGNYYLDDSLVISSNTTLKLAADAVMIRKDATKPMIRDYKGAVNKVLAGKGYGHASNITITGGIWNGNITGETASTPEGIMRIYCAKNVNISECTITGVCGYHHINLAAVDTATISNVIFTGFVKYSGTDYSSLETGEGNSNALNSSASITSEALQIDCFEKEDYYCKNITVKDCTFDGLISGVGNHHKDGTADGIAIVNNTFKNIENSCVNLYSFKNVEVRNNTATNVRAFARVYAGRDCTISSNKISAYTNTEKNKFNMFRVSDKAVLTIDSNVIQGAGASAIKLDTDSNVRITNNIIKDVALNGIMLFNSKADISGNTISKSANDAIWFGNSSGSVTANTIDHPKRFGIFTNASKTTVNDNIVTAAGEHGIYLKSGSGTVKGNIVNTSGSNGIYISKGKVTVSDTNKVSGSKERGLRVLSGKVYIEAGNVKMLVKDKELIVSGVVSTKVTEVVIPAKVKFDKETFRVTQLANHAFKNKKIIKITIGANIKKIGKNAFYKCSKLKNVFFKTKKLTEKSVGKGAFAKINKKCKFKFPRKKSKEYKAILKAAGVAQNI